MSRNLLRLSCPLLAAFIFIAPTAFAAAFTDTFTASFSQGVTITSSLGGASFTYTFTGDGDGGDFAWDNTGNGFGGSDSVNALSTSFSSAVERITIRRTDTGPFVFTGLYIDNASGGTVTVQGYLSGATVGGAQTMGTGTAGTLTFSSLQVDEVRLTSTDFFGTNFDNFSGDTTVNSAPVATTSGGTTAFTEGNNVTSTPVVIDSGITVFDSDNSTLASGTVSITGNFQSSQDVLAFTNNPAGMGNISGSYSSGTGVLTLTSSGASATLAQWQAALRSVTYSNSSNSPNTSNRTISFVINDGAASSAAGTKNVSVASTNDTPIATASGGSTAFTEGNNVTSSPVVIDSGITVSDLDSSTLSSATVSITGNLQTAEDSLAFTNNPATMGNISTSYTAGTGVLAMTSAGATATLAQWQAALRSVTYIDSSDTPNTSSRTISFSINDGSTSSGATTKTVTVASTNDSPVATASGGNSAFTEGANVTSTPVVVDSGITVSDLDNSNLASATVSITGNLRTTEDLLAFTNNPATMGNISAVYTAGTGVLALTSSGATATAAQWQAALRSVTYTNSSDTPNTSNRTISFSVSDGSTSSNVATKTVTVAAANDTPVLILPGAQVITEDTELIFSSANGNLISTSDDDATLTVELAVSNNDGGMTLASTTGITFNYGSNGSGYFNYSGTVANLNAAFNGIKYTPPTHFSSVNPVTLTVSVYDSHIALAQSGIGITVNAANAAPVAATSGGTTAFTEGANVTGTPVAVDPGITLSDADNSTFASAAVSITGNLQTAEDSLAFTNNPATMGNISAVYTAGTGVLALTSSGATATVAQWQAALRSVTYTNSSDAPNTSGRTISFVINDGSASSSAAIKVVTVAAVNDAPVATTSGGSTAFIEGNNVTSTPVVVDSGFTVTDGDNTTLAGATVAITGNFQSGEDLLAFTNNPATMGNIGASYSSGTGVLTLISASATATIAQWQAALRSVTYTNSSNTPNTGNRTIGFTANDGTSGGNTAARIVTVAGTNDAPIATASGGITAFIEGDNVASTPIIVDGGITVADGDDTTLAGATVAITGNHHSGEDVLAFANNGSSMGNIAASYSAGTGVLTLTSSGATATLAQWQTALRAVTYTDGSETPDTGNRTISFIVNDGTADSVATTRTVSVASVNDTPVNSVPGAQSVLQGSSLIFSAGHSNLISIGDVDAAGGSMQITLTATHGKVTLSGITGLSFSTGSGSDDTSMTFVGTVTAVNNALSGLTFTPTSGYSGSADLQINTNDQGNTGSGGAKADTDAIGLTIGRAVQAGLSVTSPSIATWGTAYTATATGGSGTGALSWALGAGSTAAGAAIGSSTGAVSATGAGTVVINVTKASDSNYDAATSADFTVTFGKAASIITWSAPAAIPQGTALSSVQLNASANVAGTFVYSRASGAVLNAGTQTLGVTFTPDDSGNYSGASAQQTLVVYANPDSQSAGQRSVWLMQGTQLRSVVDLGNVDQRWQIVAAADFNGDGHPDILWHNQYTGENSIWAMDGTANIGTVNLETTYPAWHIAGAGDFNHDGQADILWQNTLTGESIVWLMSGTTHIVTLSLGIRGSGWEVVGAGDFNGDGNADILWENMTTGQHSLWLMTGTTSSGEISLGTTSLVWRIVGSGDFDGDGNPDILWQNAVSGQMSLWLMNGTQVVGGGDFGPADRNWQTAAIGDFDSDGKADLLRQKHTSATADFNGDGVNDLIWENMASGQHSLWLMNGTANVGSADFGTTGLSWQIVGPGDFNRDGQTDLLWQNVTTGQHSIWFMQGSTCIGGADLETTDPLWQMATTGDFDDDGQADIILQNVATGQHRIWLMNGTAHATTVDLPTTTVAWQIVGTGDFNNDGETDVLWQNTVTGQLSVWLMNGTTNIGSVDLGVTDPIWQVAGTGDFDGDGSVDILWQNTATGQRSVWLMHGTTNTGSVDLGTIDPAWKMVN